MLGRRLLTAAILVPLALSGLFLLSNRGWGIAAGVMVGIGAVEWSRLAGWGLPGRLTFVGAIAVALIGLLLMPSVSGPDVAIWIVSCVFWLAVALPWLRGQWHPRGTVAWAVTGACVLIPAWLAAYVLQTRPGQLLAVMAIVWIADTGAYFAGRQFGFRKLAPAISPGKTWEGVAGAALCVAVYCAALHAAAPGLLPGGSFVVVIALGLGLLALSIVGDLFESWMKRLAGVKDSGSILPGHGGVLDRIDSLTASLPAAALAIRWAGA